MPILMVAQQQFNSLNFSDSDLSEPLDFTMSKFKSSSPAKHPLYHQFFGSHNNNDTSPVREVKEEQGEIVMLHIFPEINQQHLSECRS